MIVLTREQLLELLQDALAKRGVALGAGPADATQPIVREVVTIQKFDKTTTSAPESELTPFETVRIEVDSWLEPDGSLRQEIRESVEPSRGVHP